MKSFIGNDQSLTIKIKDQFFLWSFIHLITLWLLMAACRPLNSPTYLSLSSAKQQSKSVSLPAYDGNELYTALKNRQAVFRLYKQRNFQMIWSEGEKSMADSMLAFIQSSRYYGLLPTDYHSTQLVRLKSPEDSLGLKKEVLLTDAFISIAHDLRKGRLDSATYPEYDSLVFKQLEKSSLFTIRSVLDSLQPKGEQYFQLREALVDLINSTDSANRALLLSGITIDSIPLHRQVIKIELNIDRWRKEFDDLGSRFVWVNIPSYDLFAVNQNKIALESKVILGKPEAPTPTLTSSIESIILFPYWTVPRKIAVEEYLPLLKTDTSFLKKNNFIVLDNKGNKVEASSIAWGHYTVNNFPFVLRQAEGYHNALGVIKFVFANPYAVYLHDTNSRKLFSTHIRAFSHGCVRVEKAMELAAWLDDKKRIEDGLTSTVHQSIKLTRPVPIYIRYFTCAYTNGCIQFLEDIYGLDKKLYSHLYGNGLSN